MTGYGRGQASDGDARVSVEVTGVNRKQRDIRFSLPRELGSLEPLLTARVQKSTGRGCLTVSLSYELAPEHRKAQLSVDTDLAAHAVQRLTELADRVGIDPRLSLSDVLALPGVVVSDEQRLPVDELTHLALAALDAALVELREMQAREGTALQHDLDERCRAFRGLLTEIRAKDGDVLLHYQRQLRERVRQLGVEVKLDDSKLAKEAAFLAERSDITEEIVRIESHLDQMCELLWGEEPAGRPLDFLCQELSREINTLAAKTRSTTVSQLALTFKNELGKVREQVANVE